ncbi:MAG: hypothetical protein ACRCV9_18005, partial [Burkholderiaceae bacterium]
MKRFVQLVARLAHRAKFAALGALVMLAGTVMMPMQAAAYGTAVERKIAPDLKPVVLQGQLEKKIHNWLSKEKGQWLVKVLVVSNNDTDTEATALRAAVLNAGGSVYYRYLSVNALLAVLPVNQVMNIASRADVES